MVRSLFSLYIRAGVGAANLALRVAVRSADLAVGAVRMAVPSAQPVRDEPEDVFVPPAEPAPERPREVVHEPAPPSPVEEPSDETQPLEEFDDKAKTIDDEPELVAEVAEPGAEEGASAELEIDEPWDGYDKLMADEVVTRIGEADAAEVAVVELYERSHKQRRTILTAAERRQRELANAPS